jgi:endopeptidase La
MTDTTVADLMSSFLRAEYNRYSKHILNLCDHITKQHVFGVIPSAEFKTQLDKLNKLIRTMNDIFNNRSGKLMEMTKIDADMVEASDSKLDSNKTSNNAGLLSTIFGMKNGTEFSNEHLELVDMWRIYGIKQFDNLYFNDFDAVKKVLLEISEKVGFSTLDDAFDLIIGHNFRKIFQTKQFKFDESNDDSFKCDFADLFDLYNRVFIPLSYKKETNATKCKFMMKCKDVPTEYDVLIDNYAELHVVFPTTKDRYVFKGYFVYDPINTTIRTSQICRGYIYDKKKDFEKIANDLKYIHAKFKTIYIYSLTVGELLSLDKESFIKKIESDYAKYSKLANMQFSNVVKEFSKDIQTNLSSIFSTIKLLLLGPDSSITHAGFLFGMTKDRKYGAELVSEIIHRNLNFVSQSKLKKSSIILKAELEKLKSISVNDIDLRKQVQAAKNMPDNIKKILFEKIEEMKSGSSEFYKQNLYVTTLLNYPWGVNEDDVFGSLSKDITKAREYLSNCKKVLDETVFGHDECKSKMQEIIGKWISNPNASGNSIGLLGSPGVGKTLIAKSLGKALGIPCVTINLGGVEDGCVLNGHSYTYSAAQPGLIVKKMIEAGKGRCIMYFDELDKACSKHGINEIFNILIHATDVNTNDAFNDKFFQEVTFPLNKVLFVFSFNDITKVDKILLDRMQKIEVAQYSLQNKLIIAKNFLLKEISESIGIEYGSVLFDDAELEYIIEHYTFEAGVRELKRKIESLFMKLNIDRIQGTGMFSENADLSKEKPVKLTVEKIVDYLKKPHSNVKKIHNRPEIGIINGLYATTGGSGGIIPIALYHNYTGKKGNNCLKLTGSQGKVMKESVSFALTTAMNVLKEEFVQKSLVNSQYGFHLHTPDGATPKDGPSAGAAFTTVFISRILSKKIRNDIAMTGEIEINGKITAIGGLMYKLAGAKKAGVKLVFVPKENEEDLQKILDSESNKKSMFDENFSYKIVEHVSQILPHALLEDDGTPLVVANYIKDEYIYN